MSADSRNRHARNIWGGRPRFIEEDSSKGLSAAKIAWVAPPRITANGIGLAFQVPLFLLALQRVGVITASSLTGNWRYAIVIIAVIVAALPGVDPVTMTAETVPLVALYLASIVLLRLTEYRERRRLASEAAETVREMDRV